MSRSFFSGYSEGLNPFQKIDENPIMRPSKLIFLEAERRDYME